MQINEAAKQSGISEYTIRYYEKLDLLTVPRDANGIRDFTADNVWTLQQLSFYRKAGVPLRDLQTMFTSQMTEDEILQTLYRAQAKLAKEMKTLAATQTYLAAKIAWHETHETPVTALLCAAPVKALQGTEAGDTRN